MKCPVCGADTVEQKCKVVCPRCHAIVETCCDGGCEQPKRQEKRE